MNYLQEAKRRYFALLEKEGVDYLDTSQYKLLHSKGFSRYTIKKRCGLTYPEFQKAIGALTFSDVRNRKDDEPREIVKKKVKKSYRIDNWAEFLGIDYAYMEEL